VPTGISRPVTQNASVGSTHSPMYNVETGNVSALFNPAKKNNNLDDEVVAEICSDSGTNFSYVTKPNCIE